jgi:hypothetical protein
MKVKDDDGDLYILRFDERYDEWVRLGTRPSASDARRMMNLAR